MKLHELTQIVCVRRDLPSLVDISVQGGHAVGKATYLQAFSARHGPDNRYDPNDGHPHRVWRGVQNENRLREIHERLNSLLVLHVTIIEPDDGPLKGQMTALATTYYTKEELAPAFAANDTYELRMENCAAFKSEAIAHVIKQLGGHK